MNTDPVSKPSFAGADLLRSLSVLVADATRVSSDKDALLAHSFDCWPVAAKWRQLGNAPCKPDVVVQPVETAEVSRVLRWAYENRVPVVAWGMGSSVVGAPLIEGGGICIDMSRMNRVIAIEPEDLVVRVEAGAVGSVLESLLNERGLTLNHSPQSLHRSTVGGWLATRATGQFSSRYGGIEDLCVSFTAVLSDGSIVTTVQTPRMATGPDLRHLLIGSEGCFGIITDVILKVFPITACRLFQTIRFASVEEGVRSMRAIAATGLRPFLVRLYDLDEARYAMKDAAFTSPVMFLGCEGAPAVAHAELEVSLQLCRDHGGQPLGDQGAKDWMNRRFDFSHIERIVSTPGGVAETIEVSHRWTGIMPTYSLMKSRLAPCASEVLGHFSHLYTTGLSLYLILIGSTSDPQTALQTLEEIWRIAMETALETGASISHHHGTGMARSAYVPRALGSSNELLVRLKSAMDDRKIMNPGKLGLS